MENNNHESKTRKVLFKEIGVLISIIAVVITVLLFIIRPNAAMQQDIALIKQSLRVIEKNHLTTIQNNIKDINEKNDEQDKIIIDINLSLQRILTILEK